MENVLNVAKDVVKNGLIMFAVGVALSFAAQGIATAIGVPIEPIALTAANHSNPLWLGLFFGGFGAIHSAMVPALEWAFGGGTPTEKPKNAERETKFAIVLQPDLGVDQQPVLSETKFRDMIASQISTRVTQKGA